MRSEVSGMNATPQAKTVRLRQGSEAWIAFRQSHIGSSDAPAIVGESPYRSALALFLEKTVGPEVIDADRQRLFRIGHAMEPVILGLYADETGRKVAKGRVLESRDLPWLSCSLDGETDGRIIEAKWTSSSRWDAGVPGDVAVQVTHQMGVSGIRMADVAVLTPRGFTVYEYPFDQGFWDSILSQEETFRERIRLNLPPPPDGSDSSRKAIASLYPVDSGEILEADPATTTIVRELLSAKKHLADVEAEVGSLENTLRFILEDASGVQGPGFTVSYKRAKDSTRVNWQGLAESLDGIIGESAPERRDEVETIKGIYTSTTTGSRRLLVKAQEVQG
jgi:putative phage-type endonuclease